jgi:hypothetical protein
MRGVYVEREKCECKGPITSTTKGREREEMEWTRILEEKRN